MQRTETNSVRAERPDPDHRDPPRRPGNWTIIDTGAVRGDRARAGSAARHASPSPCGRRSAICPPNLALVRARMADASDRIAALRGNVDTAENTLNMIQAGLAQGINSQLEFLDAQNGVLGTRVRPARRGTGHEPRARRIRPPHRPLPPVRHRRTRRRHPAPPASEPLFHHSPASGRHPELRALGGASC